MVIENLTLKNFRNYEKINLSFSKGISIILGDNAQGKTSLIEGIYALSTSKSHRTSKDNQMIRFDQDFAKIDATVSFEENDTLDLTLVIASKGKTAKINGASTAKLSDYLGKLKTVFFAPEDLELIKGAPSNRRKFLNMEIGQIDPNYLYHLTQYSKLIKQRNEFLKKFQNNSQSDLYLEVLTEQLVPHICYILDTRKEFLEKLEKHAKNIHDFISDGKEILTFKYISTFKQENLSKSEISMRLKENIETDKRMRSTTVGPHRDDFTININGLNAFDFASQGQQRTSVLSIKLAEITLIKELSDEYPILLLDDVLSELDNHRQTKLLEATHNKTQTFITTTSISGIHEKIVDSSEIFVINDGKIGEKHE